MRAICEDQLVRQTLKELSTLTCFYVQNSNTAGAEAGHLLSQLYPASRHNGYLFTCDPAGQRIDYLLIQLGQAVKISVFCWLPQQILVTLS